MSDKSILCIQMGPSTVVMRLADFQKAISICTVFEQTKFTGTFQAPSLNGFELSFVKTNSELFNLSVEGKDPQDVELSLTTLTAVMQQAQVDPFVDLKTIAEEELSLQTAKDVIKQVTEPAKQEVAEAKPAPVVEQKVIVEAKVATEPLNKEPVAEAKVPTEVKAAEPKAVAQGKTSTQATSSTAAAKKATPAKASADSIDVDDYPL